MNTTHVQKVVIIYCIAVVLLMLLATFSGCCSTPETIVETRTIYVDKPVPVYHRDTLKLHDTVTVKGDTIWTAQDPHLTVTVHPQSHQMHYTIHDTVQIHDTLQIRDTTQLVVKEVIETPFLSKMGLVGIGILLAFAVSTLLVLFLWRHTI